MSKEHSSSIIEELHQHELDALIDEASKGGVELESTLHTLEREQKRRRGLLLAATEMDATGAWAGNVEDTPDAPPHVDQLWAAWNEPHESPKWLQAKPKDVE